MNFTLEMFISRNLFRLHTTEIAAAAAATLKTRQNENWNGAKLQISSIRQSHENAEMQDYYFYGLR